MKYKLILAVAFFLVTALFQPSFSQSKKRTYYEIKVYHFQNQKQEDILDSYFKNAFLPALNRQGLKTAGVFKQLGNDTLQDKRLYVLIPHKSLREFTKFPHRLQKDQQFLQAGASYLEADHNNAPYSRIETIVLEAFRGMPGMEVPPLKNEMNKRVYELRSYESPTEKLFQNKVHMFNEGDEIGIFKRLGFNAVFYGSVLSGSRMPNLMYLTTHEDMKQRREHWKAFGADPAWKKLSSNEFYHKNNVSKIEIVFLQPTEYSGI
ncbi:MAG TPA: NIPSNAP family protein [Sphingobacteriaceae bacterium]